MNALLHDSRVPAIGLPLTGLLALLTGPAGALPGLLLAAALLLGRLPRVALAVLALTLVLGAVGLTIASSQRPLHPGAHQARVAR